MPGWRRTACARPGARTQADDANVPLAKPASGRVVPARQTALRRRRPFLLGCCPILSAGLVLGLAWSRNDLPPERTGRIQAASRRLVTARWLIGPLSDEGLSDDDQPTGIAAPQAGQVVGGSSSAIPPQAWQTRRSQQTESPPSSCASG